MGRKGASLHSSRIHSQHCMQDSPSLILKYFPSPSFPTFFNAAYIPAMSICQIFQALQDPVLM